ncbi:MAG: hypothetical protein M3Z05_22585, partial [Gemmatimonadota bacterium]|nr:hypothetical protein [Gemmatimonadota bacterium]
MKIGRMCYWNDAGTETPPREPRSITRARLELIATLDMLSRRAPKDDWINGERVRYMIQAGQDSAAVAAARGCAPLRWRCRVVLAYAFHASQRFGDAAAEFDSALAEMSSAERCRWNDISLLLDDDESAPYDRMPCGQRDSVERHFWELAQPSFAVTGNDRRTEHFSRVLLADLSADGENPYGLGWGPDLREILIRYGEPLWYTIPWEAFVAEPSTPTGHDRSPSFHFAPDLSGGAAHWDLYAHTARERYAPAYMDTITNLAVQFAMVKRGDSALVVAVYGGGMDGTAVLGIAGAGTDSGATERTLNHVRRARAPWKAELVAMEVLGTQSRVDARAREWLRPPSHAEGAPELSTLLLFDPDSTSDVRSLNDALACALSSNELRGRRRLGLY